MKHYLTIMALLCLFMTTMNSCKKVIGKGPITTETRNITDFNSINLDFFATVNITQGTTYKVEVLAQNNLMNDILTTQNGSTLNIKHRNNIYFKSEPITINITMPTILKLSVDGSGTINGIQQISSEVLNLNLSGSGNIHIPILSAKSIESNISGSGNITVDNGTANNIKHTTSGSGKLDMLQLQANIVETSTSGSGTVKIHAMDKLDIKISGSGNVYYKGNPIISKSISGSGGIIQVP